MINVPPFRGGEAVFLLLLRQSFGVALPRAIASLFWFLQDAFVVMALAAIVWPGIPRCSRPGGGRVLLTGLVAAALGAGAHAWGEASGFTAKARQRCATPLPKAPRHARFGWLWTIANWTVKLAAQAWLLAALIPRRPRHRRRRRPGGPNSPPSCPSRAWPVSAPTKPAPPPRCCPAACPSPTACRWPWRCTFRDRLRRQLLAPSPGFFPAGEAPKPTAAPSPAYNPLRLPPRRRAPVLQPNSHHDRIDPALPFRRPRRTFRLTCPPPPVGGGPLYNEEDNVDPLLERIHLALNPYPYPWEVVIVDDGSVRQHRAQPRKAAKRMAPRASWR